MNSEAKIQELEAKVAELTALVERLVPQAVQASPAVSPAPIETTATDDPAVQGKVAEAPTRASRRNLLKLAGAAAAGTAAAVAANAMPAAAADGDPINAGESVSTTSGTRPSTVLIYANSATPQVPGIIFGTQVAANIFTVRDAPSGFFLVAASSSDYPAAIGGYSYSTVANGVYGYTANPGYGVVGYGSGTSSVGVLARGAKANVELYSAGTAPNTRSDAHLKGELICDADGTVWACVAAGSPGTWRKVAGTTTTGSLHLLAAPKRVYSSRAEDEPVSVGPKTPLSAGTRTIDCKQGSSGVPAGATGVVLNVTAIAASANGYLSVSPGASGFSGTSTLNWSANGAVVANGVTVGTGAGATVDVTVGGGGTANFIVDVMGYYL